MINIIAAVSVVVLLCNFGISLQEVNYLQTKSDDDMSSGFQVRKSCYYCVLLYCTIRMTDILLELVFSYIQSVSHSWITRMAIVNIRFMPVYLILVMFILVETYAIQLFALLSGKSGFTSEKPKLYAIVGVISMLFICTVLQLWRVFLVGITISFITITATFIPSCIQLFKALPEANLRIRKIYYRSIIAISSCIFYLLSNCLLYLYLLIFVPIHRAWILAPPYRNVLLINIALNYLVFEALPLLVLLLCIWRYNSVLYDTIIKPIEVYVLRRQIGASSGNNEGNSTNRNKLKQQKQSTASTNNSSPSTNTTTDGIAANGSSSSIKSVLKPASSNSNTGNKALFGGNGANEEEHTMAMTSETTSLIPKLSTAPNARYDSFQNSNAQSINSSNNNTASKFTVVRFASSTIINDMSDAMILGNNSEHNNGNDHDIENHSSNKLSNNKSSSKLKASNNNGNSVNTTSAVADNNGIVLVDFSSHADDSAAIQPRKYNSQATYSTADNNVNVLKQDHLTSYDEEDDDYDDTATASPSKRRSSIKRHEKAANIHLPPNVNIKQLMSSSSNITNRSSNSGNSSVNDIATSAESVDDSKSGGITRLSSKPPSSNAVTNKHALNPNVTSPETANILHRWKADSDGKSTTAVSGVVEQQQQLNIHGNSANRSNSNFLSSAGKQDSHGSDSGSGASQLLPTSKVQTNNNKRPTLTTTTVVRDIGDMTDDLLFN